MHLELHLTNDRQLISSVRALTHEALRQLSLETAVAEKLEGLVLGAVDAAVEHAYPDGEEGSITLTIRDRQGKLEFLVRDYGIPQDVVSFERRLHHHPTVPTSYFGCPAADAVDEVHWLGFGPEGKAFQIIKWLHTNHIVDRAESRDLASFRDAAPLAPEQEYVIRRMLPDEAVQASQLIYRAYGNTYFNQDVYYPERVAAQNAHNAIVSFVAQAVDGSIAGHYALERNQNGPVAEGGQAVVDPAHRGRGLLNRLKEAALEEARRLDLAGWYADAVAVHTLTQKSNATHGGHMTAVDLAVAPQTERFRNIAETQSQRVTCLLYFHWLKSPEKRTIYVPERHRPIVSAIYENLECAIRFGDGGVAMGHGTLAVRIATGAARAVIRAEELGNDTVRSICHAKRELVERSHAEVIYAELPLENPAVSQLAEDLENEGFGFLGVAPCFSTCGDLLRLAYLVKPLAREPIKTFEEFAAHLVDYTLAEQARVRQSL